MPSCWLLSQCKSVNKKLGIPFGRAVGNTSLEPILPLCLGGIWREACQDEQRIEFVCSQFSDLDGSTPLCFCSPCSAAVHPGSWLNLAVLGSE